MTTSLVYTYRKAYGGLPRVIWFLALTIFINRSGTMVIPFMSVYLTQKLKFSIDEAGLVLSVFGVGSMLGAFIGGRLTDKIGFYRVMIWSLALGGVGFIVLSWMQTLGSICMVVFVVAIVSDAFRPANSTAIAYYSTSANRTRAYALNRLAINLGFSIGPALGGFLATVGYEWLFWIDGFTCLIAAVLIKMLLPHPQKIVLSEEEKNNRLLTRQQSPYRDSLYLSFIFLCAGFTICFFQIFTTAPLYFKKVGGLSEFYIGLLLSWNGIMIVLLEMIMVYRLENKRPHLEYIGLGTMLVAISYWILAWGSSPILLILFMTITTLGEILSMPFMNVFVVERAHISTRGQYMALYTISYSLAHIFAPMLGTQLIQNFGFTILWYVIAVISLVFGLGFWILNFAIRQRKQGKMKYLDRYR